VLAGHHRIVEELLGSKAGNSSALMKEEGYWNLFSSANTWKESNVLSPKATQCWDIGD